MNKGLSCETCRAEARENRASIQLIRAYRGTAKHTNLEHAARGNSRGVDPGVSRVGVKEVEAS